MKQCYSRTGILRVKILGAAPGMRRVRAVALRVLTWRSHAQSSFTVVGPIRVPWRCQAPYRVSTFIPASHPSSQHAVEKRIKFTGGHLERACSCLISEIVSMKVTGTFILIISEVKCSRMLEFQGVCLRVAAQGSISLLCFKNHYIFPSIPKGWDNSLRLYLTKFLILPSYE